MSRGSPGDPTQADRTWVLLPEAAEGGWGLFGTAFGREEFAALAAKARSAAWTHDLGPEVAGVLRQVRTADYPHISVVLKDVRHDDDVEFDFGLDLILDGLERARDAA